VSIDPALKSRVVTASILILVVVLLLLTPHFFWWGRPLVASIALLIVSLVALESFELCRKSHPEYPLITGTLIAFVPPILSYGVCLYLIFSPKIEVNTPIALGAVSSLSLAFFSLGFFLLSLQRGNSLESLSKSWALFSVHFLFVVLGGSALLFLSILEGAQTWAIFWLLAVVSGSDIASYFAGKSFGRKHVVEALSPGKTLEGYIAGALVACLVGTLAGVLLLKISLLYGLALSLLVVLSGWSGDLFASWLKRQADVKDTGSLLPGHGGVLDRVDALLFASPLYLSMLVVFSGLYG